MSPPDHFALYIHWPYCLRRCPYCDFNAHLRPTATGVEEAMAAGLLRQLRLYPRHPQFADYFAGKKISTIFFGGGTPSLMPPRLVAELLETAHDLYGFADDIEITLEANPGALEGGAKLQDFKSAGINRLSLGVQSLRDDSLVRLGRIHNGGEAIKIIETLPRLFDRWSFDLIYARPDQTAVEWQEELSRALQFGPSHLSLYQLTIEAGTPYATMAKAKELILPADDMAADMFLWTRQTMASAGLPPYEISNFAVAGQAARHNLTYWLYGDWLGVGPGAEGRITKGSPNKENVAQRLASKNFRLPSKWLAQLGNGNLGDSLGDNLGLETITPLAPATAMGERIMMGLRLSEGVILPADKQGSDDALPADFANHWQDLVAGGLAHPPHHPPHGDQEGGRHRLTEEGFLRLNSIINYLT